MISLYMHTLWILKWRGNDFLWSKINKRSHVESELGISMVEAGGRQTIAISQRWGVIKENFAPHVLVIPFGMWEILTGWNLDEVVLPRRKLRICMTGEVGGGAPSINALAETIEAYIEGRSSAGIKNGL